MEISVAVECFYTLRIYYIQSDESLKNIIMSNRPFQSSQCSTFSNNLTSIFITIQHDTSFFSSSNVSIACMTLPRFSSFACFYNDTMNLHSIGLSKATVKVGSLWNQSVFLKTSIMKYIERSKVYAY